MSGKKGREDFNITKLDSKGRVTIPFHIREYMGLKTGSEFVIANNENKEVRIFPLLRGKVAYIHVVMGDRPGTLSKLLAIVSKHNLDILSSSSKTLERGKTAEWTAVADATECKSTKRVEEELAALGDAVKRVEITVE